MQKYYLMAPGPTAVHDAVLLEMAQPIIHHRTKDFEKLMAKVREDLKWIFQTKQEVLVLASVGSGALEASVANCFSPGDKVICIPSGKFGERWTDMARRLGLNVIEYQVEWGKTLRVSEVANIIDKNPGIKGVLTQFCETSTGVQHPIEELAALTRKSDVLLLVDAITALGIVDVPMDKWGIDVLLTGSQKALMLPPGLALIALSQRAWKANATARCTRYYFDLKPELEAHLKNQTQYTPTVSLIRGLSKSLSIMREEGLENIFKRHQRLADGMRAGMLALGLELLSEKPANAVTVARCPSGIDGEKLVAQLQTKYNLTIMGGQDHLKGKIFRVGHMGFTGDFDIILTTAALEMTLKDMGHELEFGTGVAAAMKSLHSAM